MDEFEENRQGTKQKQRPKKTEMEWPTKAEKINWENAKWGKLKKL